MFGFKGKKYHAGILLANDFQKSINIHSYILVIYKNSIYKQLITKESNERKN